MKISLKVSVSIISILVFIFYTNITYSQKTISNNKKILSGYKQKVSGNDIEYHSHESNINDALLTRCTDGTMAIEWMTQIIPEGYSEKEATFTWIAGYSCGTSSADRKFDVYINNELVVTFTTYYPNCPSTWKVEGKNGIILSFEEKIKDNVNDVMGNMFLKVPVNIYKPGSALLMKIVGEKEDSKDWYMTFKHDISENVTVTPQQAIIKTKNGKQQLIDVDIYHINQTGKATIIINNEVANKKVFDIKYGMNNITAYAPMSAVKRNVKVEVLIDDTSLYNQDLMINPVTYRELCFVSHAHTDVGYSDLQQEVMQKHINNIYSALKLIKKTANYPKEAHYIWNIESSWAVDHFMEQASVDEKNEFINAVKNNSIAIGATYNNILTGICQPEELIELTSYVNRLSTEYNVPLLTKTMMMNDIPGMNWSIVDALAQRGIKYIASGQNYSGNSPESGDRTGSSMNALGDRPVYWLSPSGKSKVLLWLAGKGYSWFHGFSVTKMGAKTKHRLLQYLNELNDKNYPYDMVQISYTIPADNGTTDEELSDFVKQWNETYESPKIINYNVNTLMEDFEKKYASIIPVVQGDFTPYWEDGAISTAKEETKVRQSSEQLHSVTALESLVALSKNIDLEKDINNVWTSILMFHEHTWGSWNSISDPDIPFTIKQWEYKKQFEVDAVNEVKNLLDTVVLLKNGNVTPDKYFEVFNPNSWKRTDIVSIPFKINLDNNSIVKDEKGNRYVIQHLATGENIFIAKDIPALSSVKYQITNNNIKENYPLSVTRYSLENQFYSIKLDSVLGSIKSIIRKKTSKELVDQNNKFKFNQYLYVPGYNPAEVVSNTNCEHTIKDYGQVMASLLVKSKPAGCKEVLQEIRLYNDIDRIDIINTVDKLKVREKESVHFAFPFNITDEDVKIGLGIGYLQPNINQIKGANKDYFCMDNWADVSNKQSGITLTCNDAPMLEMGILNNEDRTKTTHKIWIDTIPVSSTLFSYVMNNYWHTNYKADQEGITSFTYHIYPHNSFSCSDAYKRGMETAQPFITTIADKSTETIKPFFTIENPNIIIVYMKSVSNAGILARIYNASETAQSANIKMIDKRRDTKMFDSNANGDKGSIFLNDMLQPHEFRSILIY